MTKTERKIKVLDLTNFSLLYPDAESISRHHSGNGRPDISDFTLDEIGFSQIFDLKNGSLSEFFTSDENVINYRRETFADMLNNPELIRTLIRHGAKVNLTNQKKETPLHCATSDACALCLIENGADIRAKDRDGNTTLMACVQYKATVQKLLDEGMDPSVRNNSGVTAILLSNNPEITELLLKNEKKH